jgi:hypothetical protein
VSDLNRSPKVKFSDYSALITKSVAETGYDSFHPSACVPGLLKDRFHVLDGQLSEEGEEAVALAWAKSLTKAGRIFLAFRAGGRRVTVAELKDGELVDGIILDVKPYIEVPE